ncbi:hypothetical protein E2R68_02300 [Psychromonas sp. RZ22]|uniref:hypothetical protein n=1 Tax=Psychromonas algarum TaxID=2555643 RepID=UPI001067E181|nr:hypothetical protein [Psychromonas sp. RZ22]TEW55943.1 hypothetical protein E2R68_02300 [Psychromonas sp. RZ22]
MFTKDNAVQAQAKSAEARTCNAERRNAIKALITSKSPLELLDDYKLNFNLSNGVKQEIQIYLLKELLAVQFSESLKHSHKIEQMVVKSELDEMLKEQPNKQELAVTGEKMTITELLKNNMIDLSRTSTDDLNDLRSFL